MKSIQFLSTAAALLTLAAPMLAEDSTRPEHRGPRGQGGRRQGPPAEIVAKYDTNQDGQLDETERAALKADIEAGKISPPAGRGPGAGAGHRKGRNRGE